MHCPETHGDVKQLVLVCVGACYRCFQLEAGERSKRSHHLDSVSLWWLLDSDFSSKLIGVAGHTQQLLNWFSCVGVLASKEFASVISSFRCLRIEVNVAAFPVHLATAKGPGLAGLPRVAHGGLGCRVSYSVPPRPCVCEEEINVGDPPEFSTKFFVSSCASSNMYENRHLRL